MNHVERCSAERGNILRSRRPVLSVMPFDRHFLPFAPARQNGEGPPAICTHPPPPRPAQLRFKIPRPCRAPDDSRSLDLSPAAADSPAEIRPRARARA
jgi:hypothetical protein